MKNVEHLSFLRIVGGSDSVDGEGSEEVEEERSGGGD